MELQFKVRGVQRSMYISEHSALFAYIIRGVRITNEAQGIGVVDAQLIRDMDDDLHAFIILGIDRFSGVQSSKYTADPLTVTHATKQREKLKRLLDSTLGDVTHFRVSEF